MNIVGITGAVWLTECDVNSRHLGPLHFTPSAIARVIFPSILSVFRPLVI